MQPMSGSRCNLRAVHQLVRAAGLEPARLKPGDFKSPVSTIPPRPRGWTTCHKLYLRVRVGSIGKSVIFGACSSVKGRWTHPQAGRPAQGDGVPIAKDSDQGLRATPRGPLRYATIPEARARGRSWRRHGVARAQARGQDRAAPQRSLGGDNERRHAGYTPRRKSGQ